MLPVRLKAVVEMGPGAASKAEKESERLTAGGNDREMRIRTL